MLLDQIHYILDRHRLRVDAARVTTHAELIEINQRLQSFEAEKKSRYGKKGQGFSPVKYKHYQNVVFQHEICLRLYANTIIGIGYGLLQGQMLDKGSERTQGETK